MKYFYKLLALCILQATITSCGIPNTDAVRPPKWIWGIWQGEYQVPIDKNESRMVKLRCTMQYGNGSITKRLKGSVGQWLSEFDCAELEKTDSVYMVRVAFSALFEDPSEVWRWEKVDSESIRFSPIYGKESLSILMKRENALQRFIDWLTEWLRGGSNGDDNPEPPKWIKGTWRGNNVVQIDGSIRADGQLQWKFTDKEATVTKLGGTFPGEVNISDLYEWEVANEDSAYSIRARVPAFFSNNTETWRWERAGPKDIRFFPLYGSNTLTITLTKW